MSVKLLIDGVVQQTTVLIAQLSTAAGMRAPLSHVADQIFLSLAREIEAQGVGRKVVADMFGMALRAYQKKVQRLSESATNRDTTLWESVLAFVTESQPVMRRRVLERFSLDGEKETIAVLTDLVGSGLIFASGRGAASIYAATSEAERERISEQADAETRTGLLWGVIYRTPNIDQASLAAQVRSTPKQLMQALERLKTEGRIECVEASPASPGDPTVLRYRATHFLIPVGTEIGWESAVLDHFQAVTQAIGVKLNGGRLRSSAEDVVGGSTLRFQISKDHPHAGRVLGTLHRVRDELNGLWQQVSDHNDVHPIPLEQRVDVCFYYGQSVLSPDDPPTAATPTQEEDLA